MRYLILLIACCWCGATAAQNLVLERSFYEDKSAQLSLSEARQQEYTPFEGAFSQGFSDSAFWIRLKIDGAVQGGTDTGLTDRPPNLLLRIQPSLLDEVLLFDPSISERARAAGDRHPMDAQSFLTLDHSFTIPMSLSPRYIWLRLHTTSPTLMRFELLPMAAAVKADRIHAIQLSLLVGCLGFFLVWGGMLWAIYRESLLLMFSLSKWMTLMHVLAVLGYLRLALGAWMSPHMLDKFTNLMVVSASVAATLFHIHFLREFKPATNGLRMLYAFVGLYPIQLLLLMFNQAGLAVQMVNWSMLLGPVAFLWVANTCTAWSSGQAEQVPYIPKSVLIGFYLLLTLALWTLALSSLGITFAPEWLVQGYPIYGVFNGVLLLMLLQRRAQHMEKMHLVTAMRLNLAQHQIDQEQKQLQQQSSFISMLTHELKTPLAVIRLALGALNTSPAQRQRASMAVSDMSAVIERCVQVGRLEERGSAIQRTEVDVTALVQQLCNNTNAPDRFALIFQAPSRTVVTDPELLRIVLSNLVDNALKYAAPDSPIRIRVQRHVYEHTDGIAIFVQNAEGPCGKPSPGSVFKKYYRNPNALGRTGSGLGLHLSAWLALQLGGELRFNPKDYEVEFECRLPV